LAIITFSQHVVFLTQKSCGQAVNLNTYNFS